MSRNAKKEICSGRIKFIFFTKYVTFNSFSKAVNDINVANTFYSTISLI